MNKQTKNSSMTNNGGLGFNIILEARLGDGSKILESTWHYGQLKSLTFQPRPRPCFERK